MRHRAWHDRPHFFKYYTAKSAILTLRGVSRKWSSPLLFNDPFDNQFELQFAHPDEQGIEQLVDAFISVITSNTAIAEGQLGTYTRMTELIRRESNIDWREASIFAELKAAVAEGIKNAMNYAPTFAEQISKELADTSIFCLTEEIDNILMWSHYSENHSGLVIKFLALESCDSPLLLAQQVQYSRTIPHFDWADMFDCNRMPKNIISAITLTKSQMWAYEKEWRIVSKLRDGSQTYEICEFAPEEVGAIYLGCRMEEKDRIEIIEIVRAKYPDAELYQAAKSPHEFTLKFEKVLLG